MFNILRILELFVEWFFVIVFKFNESKIVKYVGIVIKGFNEFV